MGFIQIVVITLGIYISNHLISDQLKKRIPVRPYFNFSRPHPITVIQQNTSTLEKIFRILLNFDIISKGNFIFNLEFFYMFIRAYLVR